MLAAQNRDSSTLRIVPRTSQPDNTPDLHQLAITVLATLGSQTASEMAVSVSTNLGGQATSEMAVSVSTTLGGQTTSEITVSVSTTPKREETFKTSKVRAAKSSSVPVMSKSVATKRSKGTQAPARAVSVTTKGNQGTQSPPESIASESECEQNYSYANLFMHTEQVRNELLNTFDAKSLICQICPNQSYVSRDKARALRHARQHHSNPGVQHPFKCTKCKTTFSQFNNSTRHLRRARCGGRILGYMQDHTWQVYEVLKSKHKN